MLLLNCLKFYILEVEKMADRRNWSIAEEDLLISILQEIVVAGGRSDNGSFRAGTHDQIVLKMREKNPGPKHNIKTCPKQDEATQRQILSRL